jgi:hypothetical protein
MWHSLTPSFASLRSELDALPIVETHEHNFGLFSPEPDFDILGFFAASGYYKSDLQSAAADYSPRITVGLWSDDALCAFLADVTQPFQARDNLAIALTELVDTGWLTRSDALDLARAWLFDNPNRIFGMDLAGR